MQALSISQLERMSGVPRSTVYFYVREGLLPTAQKAAASRAIYSDLHLELLREIDRLQGEGLDLAAIKERLSERISSGDGSEVDLVARQTQQTRQSILETSARLFARRGYQRTRVADIIKEVGITPPVFYSHFPTKRELFIECFGIFVHWMHGFLEPELALEPDPVVHLISRIHAYFGLQALSPDLLSLTRAEALHEDGELRKVVRTSYAEILGGPEEDLARLRGKGQEWPPISDELMVYGLLGANENMVMRASWDKKFSNRDVIWAQLLMFLALEAVYTGRLDLREELERYRELVERVAASAPPVPPAARA